MNKVAIITGASRGIGAATARLLAAQGHDIAINYLTNKSLADQLVEELQATGVKALALQADVAQESQVLALFEQVDRQLGTVTALVNNAGTLELQADITGIDAERLQRVFNLNVVGSFICCREAVKRMLIENGGAGGAIVNVSSIAAKLGAPNEYLDYAASKGAIDTMTIGLAKEVAHKGIRVNAVRPGFIYTDIHAAGGEPGRVDRVKALVPMKRGGQAQEVAQAIAWLLSGESSYTTGAFIDVAGGR